MDKQSIYEKLGLLKDEEEILGQVREYIFSRISTDADEYIWQKIVANKKQQEELAIQLKGLYEDG